ncbi:hypothetical protein ACROYT_G025022 [Oculina patagonica]
MGRILKVFQLIGDIYEDRTRRPSLLLPVVLEIVDVPEEMAAKEIFQIFMVVSLIAFVLSHGRSIDPASRNSAGGHVTRGAATRAIQGNCKATGVFANVANIDEWCRVNCETGYCPATYCECS